MKLAFFDDYKLGVVVGDKIVDVSSVAKGIKGVVRVDASALKVK